MKSIKAIVIGSIFIVAAILLLQLAYIFIAVGYNALAKDYPFLNDIVGWFRYLIGIPVFVAVMFVGGYLTADIAKIKVIVHCSLVAFVTAGGMTLWAMESAELTVTGMVVFVLALVSANAGGLYWKKGNQERL
ncbi:hypothetical protein ACFL3P_05875 [Pseudomonadota bacterium]